jgi:transcriptional regulator with XRE-family HTH domain
MPQDRDHASAPMLLGRGTVGARDFGARLRELREAANMSRGALASLAEVTEAYVGMVERGDRAPRAQTARKLLKAVGRNPAAGDLEVDLRFTDASGVVATYELKRSAAAEEREWLDSIRSALEPNEPSSGTALSGSRSKRRRAIGKSTPMTGMGLAMFGGGVLPGASREQEGLAKRVPNGIHTERGDKHLAAVVRRIVLLKPRQLMMLHVALALLEESPEDFAQRLGMDPGAKATRPREQR